MSLKLGRRGLWGSRWSLRGREPPNVTNGRSSEIAVRPPFARMNVSIAAAPVRLFPKTCPWTTYTRVGHRQSSESLVVGVLDGLRRSVHALVGAPRGPPPPRPPVAPRSVLWMAMICSGERKRSARVTDGAAPSHPGRMPPTAGRLARDGGARRQERAGTHRRPACRRRARRRPDAPPRSGEPRTPP